MRSVAWQNRDFHTAFERYMESISAYDGFAEGQYTTIDAYLTLLGVRWPFLQPAILELIEKNRISSLGHPFLSKLAPLDE